MTLKVSIPVQIHGIPFRESRRNLRDANVKFGLCADVIALTVRLEVVSYPVTAFQRHSLAESERRAARMEMVAVQRPPCGVSVVIEPSVDFDLYTDAYPENADVGTAGRGKVLFPAGIPGAGA